MPSRTIVFVHGWSASHTDTYGELPQRLVAEAQAAGEEIAIENLWLSRYVSFRDEVRMPDLTWAMERAVERDLGHLLAKNERFAVNYTGELGSDGVVRVASANLNAGMVRLVQDGEETAAGIPLVPKGKWARSPRCAFRLISGAAHSGETMGIMRSVGRKAGGRGAEVVAAIRRCLQVGDAAAYSSLCDAFATETEAVMMLERAEHEVVPLWRDRAYIHDAMSMVIFRIVDSEGHPVVDLDLTLTGAHDDPDLLPEGFLTDRQRNLRQKQVLTFFLNQDVMVGCEKVLDPREDLPVVLRAAQEGIETLGLRITPRPEEGFVHYVPAAFAANKKLLRDVVRPNETTLVEIVLRRIVHEGVFRLGAAKEKRADFSGTDPDEALPPKV